jgi:D-sedoheptulose 7-phosphate isomerase
MTPEIEEKERANLRALVDARFHQSMSIPEVFFSQEAGRIAEACWAMARRFHKGGRLLAFGNGASATDAQHVSVEFVHPVIVGKRALPALALTNDSATLSGLMAGGDSEMPFVRQLQILGRPQDMAMGFSEDGSCLNVVAALTLAKRMGMLTLGLTGGNGGSLAQLSQDQLDYCFIVPTSDPLVIQETHETLYHVLWELVHIFFEHEGLLT